MKIFTFLVVFLLTVTSMKSQDINFDASSTAGSGWLGYINVFDNPHDGTMGPYMFGSGWGIADLVAIMDTGNNTVTLKPNRIGDTDVYWQTPGELEGNKIMDASCYIEDDGLRGLVFSYNGEVTSNTLVSTDLSFEFTYKAFVKVYSSDYSTVLEELTYDLSPGAFTIDFDASGYNTDEHIQYGFNVVGPNINSDASFDSAYDALGSIVIGANPNISVSENEIFDFSVYPNPTQDVWHVTTSNIIDTVEIFDVLGKRVAVVNADNQSVSIDASSFDAGTYFARINTQMGSQTTKLIKK